MRTLWVLLTGSLDKQELIAGAVFLFWSPHYVHHARQSLPAKRLSINLGWRKYTTKQFIVVDL